MTWLFAALLLAAPDVSVTVKVKKLSVGRASKQRVLKGAVEVDIENRGQAPIELQHLDVHGLAFRDAKGTDHFVVHPCDCAFLFGKDRPPPDRTFTLRPGEKRTLTFDDWSCQSVWTPPPPGRYELRYRVLPAGRRPAADRAEVAAMMAQCPSVLASDELWAGAFESAPVTVVLR